MNLLYEPLLRSAIEIIDDGQLSIEKKLKDICELLNSEIPYYDWVGFYMANHETKTLHLGPYVGEPTEHTVISFGKGICGQVAISNKTFLVDDVSSQDNYIACSITVKSEIVVPLFVNGVNIGQIDIDSHKPAAFTADDQLFLETLNNSIANLFA